MQVPKSTINELQLLRKEIEAIGDDFDHERLELRTEIDRLKVEIESLKSALRQTLPAFNGAYEKSYADKLHDYDPEAKGA